jgi:hypothetical protein
MPKSAPSLKLFSGRAGARRARAHAMPELRWRFAMRDAADARIEKKHWKKAVSCNVVSHAPASRPRATDSIGAWSLPALRDRLGHGTKIISPKC